MNDTVKYQAVFGQDAHFPVLLHFNWHKKEGKLPSGNNCPREAQEREYSRTRQKVGRPCCGLLPGSHSTNASDLLMVFTSIPFTLLAAKETHKGLVIQILNFLQII